MIKTSETNPTKVRPEDCPFNIVVIEDDSGLNLLIRKNLKREGFQVDWAENGKTALSKITGHESELLLVDYKLPDMSGKDLIEKVAQKFKKLPHFIIMTGFGDENIAVEMMKMGAKDYLVKEANFIDLLPEKLKQICAAVGKTNRLEKAEETIRKQNQLIKETGQMAKVGGWELDPLSNTLTFSETTKSIHEVASDYTPSLQEGLSFYPPEARRIVEKAVETAIKDGKEYNLELPFQTAKGRKIWVCTIGKPEMKEGKCIRLHGTFQDITTRKLYEKKLLELNSHLSLAQNIAKLGYWNFDPKTQLPQWTDECFNMFNIPKEKGEPFFQEQKKYVHPDDWELYESTVQKAITDDMPYDIQIRLVHDDGNIVWIRTKGFPRKNSKGEVTELFGIIQDISDFKMTEIALQKATEKAEENEIQFRLLFDKSPDMIIISNKKGEIIKCNEAALKFHNIKSVDEFKNYITSDFYVNQKERDALVKELLKTGYLQNKEIRFKSIETQIEIDCLVSVEILKSNLDETLFITSIRDISKIKKQENALIKAKEKAEENEKQYRNLFENLVDEVHVWKLIRDNNGKILNWELTDVNSSALKSWGKTKEQVVGKCTTEIFNHDSLTAFMPIVKEIFETGKSCSWESYFPPTDQYLSMDSIPLGDYFISTGRDVTEKKQVLDELVIAKERAEESEYKVRNMFENTEIGIIFCDSKGDILEANPAILDILGSPSIEVSKKVNMLTFKPLQEIGFTQNVAKCIAEKTKIVEDVVYTSSYGKTVYLKYYLVPVVVKNQVVGVWINLNNLTDQWETRKELVVAKEKAEQSKKRFKSLIENAPDAVAINDKEGRLTYISPNAYRHFGYSENEIIGHFGEEFTHPEDLNIVYKAIDTIIRNPDQKTTVKYRFRKRNGEYRWIETTFTNLLNDKAIAGFVLNFSDITEKKQVLDELVIAKERAEEADRLKSAFLANMSHEIRTPMNGILGFTSLLLEPDLSGEERQDYIEIIQKSGDRMLNTVNDIINISKIESGLAELAVSEVDINEQLKYLYAFFKPQAEKKSILLTYKNCLPKQHIIIKTDLEKFNSILMNLIKNAIKYTNQGSIELGCSIKGNLKSAELEFFVKDTGIGIPKNRQQAIFERFVQADIEDKNAMQGSGLGLAISKAYAEMMGGKLGVESEEGVGSTFYFTMPFQNAENNKSEAAILEPNQQTAISNKKFKILVAEDDEVSFAHLSIVIKDMAREIIHAKTGLEAVELCKKNADIDIILMDIKMPELNGYEASRRIREFNKEVVIIAQTAYALAGDKNKSIEAGCNDHITKPIVKDKLLSLIQQYAFK